MVRFRCCLRGWRTHNYMRAGSLGTETKFGITDCDFYLVPGLLPLYGLSLKTLTGEFVSHGRQGLWLVRVKNRSTDVIRHTEGAEN